MKILHVVNSLQMGGAEKLVHDLALAQKKKGVDVGVLMLKEANTYLYNDLIDAQIPVICLSKTIGLYNPIMIILLLPYISKYDLIHVHLFPAQYWVGFAKLLSFAKTKLITTEHSTNNRRMNHFILKYIDRFVYRYCYKFIVSCADKVKDVMLEKYNKANHISIDNGVDIARFNTALPYSKEMLGFSDDSFVICMVARFDYPKRQDLLINALPFLSNNICIVFAGGGDSKIVEEVVKEMGLESRVRFLGIRSDIPQILKTCDVVALLSEYEGLSLSSIEGMSVGKPFIASNVEGLREIVNGAGLLVKNESEELAKAIESLEDKILYNEISAKCLERSKEYDLSIMVDKYHEVYMRCLSYV